MIEIRFHGRGGQGAQVACSVLAKAAFMEGKDVQSFPYFGVERRGAPVTAFTKIDDRPIRVKSQIYEPDHVVVLDQKLVGSVDVASGLKEGGIVLINSEKPASAFPDVKGKVMTVNATAIATEHGVGTKESPIVNTAILGAFAKATGLVKIDSIIAAILELPRKPDMNAKAARAAYDALEVDQ